jgi:glycosyltransferase involved in cell wall biosynthesis
MTKYYYLLPKKNFFKRGYRGSVIHALGIVNGFNENHIDITVLHFGGLSNFRNDQKEIVLKNFFNSVSVLLGIVKKSESRLLIRYSMSNIALLYILTIFARTKTTICLEVNTVYQMYGKKGLVYSIMSRVESYLLQRFQLIYVVSNGAKDFLIKNYNARPESIIVLPNALIMSESDKTHIDYPQVPNHRLVYFGSLHGYYDVIEICKWLDDYKSKRNIEIELHIYGNDDRSNTGGLKEKYGDLVNFHGSYDNSKIKTLIKSKDILVLPYKQDTIAEFGSPTKLFEYMGLQLPILSSAVGQLKDILVHGQSAMLYNDQTSFDDSLTKLLSDDSLGKALAEQAYHNVRMEHTWKKRIEQLVNHWRN